MTKKIGRERERETIEPSRAVMSPTASKLSNPNGTRQVSAHHQGGEAHALLKRVFLFLPFSQASPARAISDAMEPSARWLTGPTPHRQIVVPRARAYTHDREDKRGPDYRDHMLHLGWNWTSSRAKKNIQNKKETGVKMPFMQPMHAELGVPARGGIRMGQVARNLDGCWLVSGHSVICLRFLKLG